jgi:hypothetical protein
MAERRPIEERVEALERHAVSTSNETNEIAAAVVLLAGACEKLGGVLIKLADRQPGLDQDVRFALMDVRRVISSMKP